MRPGIQKPQFLICTMGYWNSLKWSPLWAQNKHSVICIKKVLRATPVAASRATETTKTENGVVQVYLQDTLFAHRNGIFKILIFHFSPEAMLNRTRRSLKNYQDISSSSSQALWFLWRYFHDLSAVLTSSSLLTAQVFSGSCVQGQSPRPKSHKFLPTISSISHHSCSPSSHLGA